MRPGHESLQKMLIDIKKSDCQNPKPKKVEHQHGYSDQQNITVENLKERIIDENETQDSKDYPEPLFF